MIKRVKRAMSHPLISGSATIVFGTNVANFLNLMFNFFMLRLLSPADYGILVTLVSIITLFVLLSESFSPTIVNFTSRYFAKQEIGMIKSLFYKSTTFSIIIGILVFLFFITLSPTINRFLNIPDKYLLEMVGVCVFLSIIAVVNRSIIQAKLAFIFISVVAISASLLKLISGTLFALAGFKVYSGLFAFFLSFSISYLSSFLPLRFLFKKNIRKKEIDTKKILQFGFPSALSMLGLTLFVTSDILLVKHFFDPVSAGLYAGLEVVAKVIFFFSAPVATVMFPLVVRKYESGENYHKDFLISLLLVFLPSVILAATYFVIPEIIIKLIMKHDEYLYGKQLLGWFGLFIALYSSLFIITSFYLSIHKTRVYIPILTLAIIQIILIWFIHYTLFHVIIISLTIVGLLLVLLLLYYWIIISKERKAIKVS